MFSKQEKNPGPSFRALPGRILWRMPFPFDAARLAGPPYFLRCLLFHDVADQTSEFTRGIGVTLSVAGFEATIKFVSQHYTPVGLGDFLDFRSGTEAPHRPLLVTFDDAYASVALNAAPILRQYNVPAVFFVTGSLVGNEELGLDNLLCYAVNTSGFEAVRSAAHRFALSNRAKLESLEDIFDNLLPTLSQQSVREFRAALATAAGISTEELARKAQLYIGAEQLRALTTCGFEIGNHTFSHVFCRSLRGPDFEQEIAGNKAKLEAISGTKVRAFSVPYGSPLDLTAELSEELHSTGHQVAFLARDRSNSSATDPYWLNRVNMCGGTDADFFNEIEILPRLRSLADVVLRRNQRPREGLRTTSTIS